MSAEHTDRYRRYVLTFGYLSYIDTLFRCFDFLLDRGVKVSGQSAQRSPRPIAERGRISSQTDDVSINDLMTGNQPHLIKLAEIIRTRFET